MQIMPDPLRTATAPIDIAKDLEKQAADPNSALRSGKLTRQTQGFQVLSLPSAVNTDFDKDLKGLNKDPLQTPTDELEKEVLEVQREVTHMYPPPHMTVELDELTCQLHDVHAELEDVIKALRVTSKERKEQEETLLFEHAELLQELKVLRQIQDAEAEAAASYARQLHPTITTPTIPPPIPPTPRIPPPIPPTLPTPTPTITPYDTLSPTTTTEIKDERQTLGGGGAGGIPEVFRTDKDLKGLIKDPLQWGIPEVSKTSSATIPPSTTAGGGEGGEGAGMVTRERGSGSCGVGLKLVWRPPGAYTQRD